jgi:hypothetical protein
MNCWPSDMWKCGPDLVTFRERVHAVDTSAGRVQVVDMTNRPRPERVEPDMNRTCLTPLRPSFGHKAIGCARRSVGHNRLYSNDLRQCSRAQCRDGRPAFGHSPDMNRTSNPFFGRLDTEVRQPITAGGAKPCL